MKTIFLLGLILIVANSYTVWDNWHNVPVPWVPNPSNAISSTSSLSGWTKNGPSSQHYSGMFNNYSKIYTQYMYWEDANEDTLIFCGPKFYLFSENLCKKDPYFVDSQIPTYCIPNYFQYQNWSNICPVDNPEYGSYPCCF